MLKKLPKIQIKKSYFAICTLEKIKKNLYISRNYILRSVTIIYGKLILGFLLCLDSWISVASHFIVSFINDHEIEYQTYWAQILQELAFKKPVALSSLPLFLRLFQANFTIFLCEIIEFSTLTKITKTMNLKREIAKSNFNFWFQITFLVFFNKWMTVRYNCTYKSLFISVCYKIIHTHLWQVNYPKKVIKVDFKTTFTTCSTIY